MTSTIKSPTYRVYNSHHDISTNVQAISAADARRLAAEKDKRYNHRDTEAEKSWIHESVELDEESKTFTDVEDMGQSNFDKFKAGALKSGNHEFHYDPKEQITTVHWKKDGKHISTFNHRTGKMYGDKHPKNESVDLIAAISEGDTVTASELFSAMLHEKVAAKVADKKKEVSKDLIAQALRDKNVHVRMAAAKNATDPKHHEMAMADKHLHVKLAVLNNPHLYAGPKEEVKKGKSPVEKLINHIKKFKEDDK